jgi:hypothetical protein
VAVSVGWVWGWCGPGRLAGDVPGVGEDVLGGCVGCLARNRIMESWTPPCSQFLVVFGSGTRCKPAARPLGVAESSTNWPSPTVDSISTSAKAHHNGVILAGIDAVLVAINPIEAGICARQARPGCRRGLPGCPQHERYWRAVAGLCRACDLEAGPLIEGDGTRIRGLEVRGQMAPVDRGKAGP